MNTTITGSNPWPTSSSFGDAPPDTGIAQDESRHAARANNALRQPPRARRDEASIPTRTSDAFADYVLRAGSQAPMTEEQMFSARIGILRSISASRPRLADRQTADMIGNTLLDAMNRSPAFRSVVSYSFARNGGRFDNLTFRNEYIHNASYLGAMTPIGSMTISYLQSHGTNPLPVTAESDANRAWRNIGPYVNLGVAPNPDTPASQAWQAVLIHEITHHLTGADDPSASSQGSHLGPTEIIARRIAGEMGWDLPTFRGYGDPARVAYHLRANWTGLLEAAQRNGAHEHSFFERLENISDAHDASSDFHELDPPGAAGNATHNASVLADMEPDDLERVRFHDGEVSFFPFADSAPAGKPDGYQSAYAASSASWDTQGRFFRYGEPVGGNPHVRQYDFPDGSKAVITAHQPTLAASDLTGFETAVAVGGAALGGAVVGFVGSGGNPAGAYLGGAAGAAAGSAIAAKFPYDRIWQGYTLEYFNQGETAPYYTQSMYAWDSGWSRVGLLSRQRDSNLWPDYADTNPDKNWNWWTWRAGNAPKRT
jgi:hypothetical protein